jgi:hypothetical protein
MNVDTQLKQLDAARYIPEDLVHQPRARQTLTAILEHDAAPDVTPARRSGRRVMRYAVAAGTVLVAGAMVTNFLGGSAAYASWTATARLANPIEEAKWGADCLSRWSGHGYTVRLVELRGRYAYTVLAGSDGYEATCLMEDRGAGHEVLGGGYQGPLKQNPPSTGLVTNSVRAQSDDNGDAAFEVTGKAGPHVASIVIEADGVDVQATLKDGYFAAWWPGRDSMIPKGGPPNPRVTITLDDGTTHTARIQDFDVSPL